MNYKSENPKFHHDFQSNLDRFIREYRLFCKSDSLLMAVSGGVDSMALAFAIKELYIFGYSNSLRVLHINHGTREGQTQEAQLVSDYCDSLGIEFKSIQLSKFESNTDFENQARIKRYDHFHAHAKAGEKILLAHHIDDSFEWTLLQSLRSSNIEGMVGIPVVNGNIIRPFMCVTKKQILRFAKYLDLPFLEDPTNESLRFERNFIRHSIVDSFSERYQGYLRHYVYRHNEIARRLKCHRILDSNSSFKIDYKQDSVLIYNISSRLDISGLERVLLKGVKHLSSSNRGTTAKQIKNICQALQNNKYGPLTLSGGVEVYLDFNCILLIKSTESVERKPGGKINKKMTLEQFSHYLEKNILLADHMDFPFFVEINRKNGNAHLDTRAFKTTFNISLMNEIKGSGVNYYTSLKLLREWSKKQNRHKVLDLEFFTSV